MDGVMKQAINNLNEKLDTIEKKVDIISDRQSEQSRRIGEMNIHIEHGSCERRELKEEFRRKDKFVMKLVGGFVLATLGFIGNILYGLVSTGNTK